MVFNRFSHRNNLESSTNQVMETVAEGYFAVIGRALDFLEEAVDDFLHVIHAQRDRDTARVRAGLIQTIRSSLDQENRAIFWSKAGSICTEHDFNCIILQ